MPVRLSPNVVRSRRETTRTDAVHVVTARPSQAASADQQIRVGQSSTGPLQALHEFGEIELPGQPEQQVYVVAH